MATINQTGGPATSASAPSENENVRRLCAWCATAAGAGAIAVIAVTGLEARMALAEMFHGAKNISAGAIKLATLKYNGQEIDEALIVCRHEEYFEIHAHGGVVVVEQILDALRAVGAVIPVHTGDFPISYAVKGHYDSSAPAILDEVLGALPAIDNAFVVHLLANQHEKGLAAWGQRLLRQLRSRPHADELWRVHSQAQWILERAIFLEYFLRPPRIALVGLPNAGKSTLLNALAGRSVSITSDIAGTTRDWVDVTIRLTAGAVSMNAVVVDTAGIRATDDMLERESISRSHQQTLNADVVVTVLDGTLAVHPVMPLTHRYSGRQTCAWIYAVNKMDMPLKFDIGRLPAGMKVICLSARHGEGVSALHSAILEVLGVAGCDPTTPMVWTNRQRRLLETLSQSETIESAAQILVALCGTADG